MVFLVRLLSSVLSKLESEFGWVERQREGEGGGGGEEGDASSTKKVFISSSMTLYGAEKVRGGGGACKERV